MTKAVENPKTTNSKKTHAEKLATKRAYYEKNKERILTLKQKSYQNHREDRIESMSKYYLEIQEKCLETQRKYRDKNRAIINEKKRNKYSEKSK